MPFDINGQEIGEVWVGGAGGTLTEIAEGWVYDGTNGWRQVYSAVQAPVAMGVTLPADWTGPSGSFATPPGWAARAGFPSTVLASNKLDMVAGVYTVTTDINHGYQYNKFGVQVVDAAGKVHATRTDDYFGTYDLVGQKFWHPGGLLDVQTYSSATFSGSNVIKAGSWAEMQPATGVVPAGVTKSGDQTLPINTWTALAGYVEQVIGTDFDAAGLTIRGDGQATIAVNFSRGYANGDMQGRIRLNGAVVATSALSGATDITASWTGAVKGGDRVTLEGWTSSVFNASEIFDSGTYITVTPA